LTVNPGNFKYSRTTTSGETKTITSETGPASVSQETRCALIVKLFDYRASIGEVVALRAIKEFFENFSPQKSFCVINHCDVQALTPRLSKTSSPPSKSGVALKSPNVIFSENKEESLKSLLDKLQQGNMKFVKNIRKSARRLIKSSHSLRSSR
jgi:hypothetical protein